MNETASTPTLHHRIRIWLLESVQGMAPGSMMPTEVEVAKRFGASRLTAHKVLAELQRDGVVRRVKGKGTFVEPRASTLVNDQLPPRNGRVVLAYPHWFSFDIWAKADRAALLAREMRLDPVEHRLNPGDWHDGLARLIARLDDVRGVLLIPPGAVVGLGDLKALDRLGIPVGVLVPVEQVTLTERVFSLSKDCFKAGHLMVDALARRGHQRIAYIANEPWSASSDLTYDGIKQGLYAAGLKLRDLERSDERVQPWENSMEAGCELTASLLRREPGVTALIYDSVPGVVGGLAAVRESGRDVPGDVSLVVNDAYADVEQYLWPAIAGIVVDRAALVRRALRLITGQDPVVDRIMREDVRLVERASLGQASIVLGQRSK